MAGCVTGNGATATLDAGGLNAPAFSGALISIGDITVTGSVIDNSNLASAVAQYCAGDLKDFGSILLTLELDPAEMEDTDIDVYDGSDDGTDEASLVIDLGSVTDVAQNETYTGNGFIEQKTITSQANNERVLISFLFRFSGTNTPDWAV